MEYKKGDVCSFLLHYQVEKGSEFTHTSMVKPTGAFYIPSEKIDEFYDLYKRAVAHKEDLYVTEKHRDISPILIDFDFRFEIGQSVANESAPPTRSFGDDEINEIVKMYATHVFEYFDVPEFTAYVMLKPSPVVDKGMIKDGIHIVIPDIVSKPMVQKIIRKKVLDTCGPLVFDKMNLKNSYEDVIDEAVIERNNWQMYGSKKPNGTCYQVTHIVKVARSGEMTYKEKIPKDRDLIEVLSIRNKYDPTTLKIEKVEEVKLLEEEEAKKRRCKMQSNAILQNTQNTKRNTVDNLEYVRALVDILDPSRAERYLDWIKVGWCLRNIDYRLLDAWISFSQKSSKFVDGECEKIWNYMKDDGLGLGTLHMWAKSDNLEAYKEINKKDLSALVYKSTNETHHDVACVVHHMFKYEFVCVSIRNNLWYEYKNHRWVNCDSGFSLRARISKDVCKEYMAHAAYWSNRGSTTDDEMDQKKFAEIVKKLNGIALKLKQTAFKDNIMKECRELFYVEKFEEKLDSRCALIGFENGVYDLDAMEFREGRPEDYVSFSTGINYTPYDQNHPTNKDMQGFLNTVFTKPHIKDYVMTLFASFLNGGIREERFHIWTGSGCFARGTPILMYDGTIKNVEDIMEGDVLMGDDSTPRTVQQLFNGFSDMYNIIPKQGDVFTVNGQHDLVVKAAKTDFIMNKKGRCVAKWVEYSHNDDVLVQKKKVFMNTIDAEAFLMNNEKAECVVKRDDVIVLTVHQYLRLHRFIKRRLLLYRPDMVDFPCARGELKDFMVSPYDFGAGLCVNGEDTRIPVEYLTNTKEVRLEVLRGVLDKIGKEEKKTYEFVVEYPHVGLIEDVMFLAKSLGITCVRPRVLRRKPLHPRQIAHQVRRGTAKPAKVELEKVTLIGGALRELPMKRNPAKKRPSVRENLLACFKVHRVKDDYFFGFELDGNRRFLLGNGDFMVVKNSNGKSKCIDLFEQSFGEYCCKLPVTLLTSKRAASNAATSELARTKGKRFACLQEPSEDEKINVGLMKELTGGDKIQARMLYKEPIEFKPQTKMILTCNHLPHVPSDDGGTWRRIRVVEFTSRFCEKPDPEKPNEFPMDTELSDKFALWKEQFMALLIEYYRKYAANGITEPDEVLQCTKEYQKNNDIFLEFIEHELERCDTEVLTYSDVFSSFKIWSRDNNLPAPTQKKKDFITAISKNLGKVVKINNVDSWKGWRFKGGNDIHDDLDG